ncbi:MAG: acyltransferase [Cytophagaceae bacterium]|nr:acyltransferase [Cytophagaceae bacterium]
MITPDVSKPEVHTSAYFGQLDGIRFLSVLVVMLDHWLGERNVLPLGYFGVNTFFVLSGFLITSILLKSKLANEAGGTSKLFTIKNFVIRRSLRIFPAYYLTITVLILLSVSPVRELAGWYYGYATNFYIAIHNTWLGTSDHLWSLAVEEQFYLVFPWLVMFTPRRWLLPLFWALIALSVGLRIWLWLAQKPWVIEFVSTPTCLDALVGGSLLAHFFIFFPEQFSGLWRRTMPLFVAAWVVLIFITWQYWAVARPNFGTDVLQRLLFSMIAFWVIAKTVVGFQGWFGAFLEHPVIAYFGKISYGLYLYHNFVYNFYHTPATHPVARLLAKVGQFSPALASSVVFQVGLFFGLTVVLATLSWYLVEKPVNNLKRFYAY